MGIIKCECDKILARKIHGDIELLVSKVRIPGGGDPWPYLVCDCGKVTALTLSNIVEGPDT